MSKEVPITISSWTFGEQCRFEERVRAAKEAGYEGIGLRAENYVDALAEGLCEEEILAILKKYEMRVTEIEYIVEWAEEPRSYEQKYKEQICFRMCDLFGVHHINCGLMEKHPMDDIVQKLKELCKRAGKYIIALEPMPYSGIFDVKAGWEIIKKSGCENAKLLLDSWHWVRAELPIELSVLEDIPADKIVSIQINDVWERAYAKNILRAESLHDRLAPQAGIGITAPFLKMLKEKGVKPSVIGVEVISDENLKKGLEYTAKYTYEKTKEMLEEVWPELLEC